MKKGLKRFISFVLAIVIFVSGWFAAKKIKTKAENKDYNSITSSFGVDSEATKIYEYIGLSKDLNKFSKEYGVSEKSVVEAKEESITLLSPEEIKEELKSIKTLISKKGELDTNQKQQLYYRIVRLMIQEDLVNGRLYDAYSDVYSILNKSLQTYAGEKYGVLDIENLHFYEGRMYYGDDFDKSTNIGYSGLSDGSNMLKNLTTWNDPNPNDNNNFNPGRNKILKDGLLEAADLIDDVNDKDLYSKSAAKKLRK